jgi:hypothetical protein
MTKLNLRYLKEDSSERCNCACYKTNIFVTEWVTLIDLLNFILRILFGSLIETC